MLTFNEFLKSESLKHGDSYGNENENKMIDYLKYVKETISDSIRYIDYTSSYIYSLKNPEEVINHIDNVAVKVPGVVIENL